MNTPIASTTLPTETSSWSIAGLIDAANFVVGSGLTIGLAVAGIGAMSFAWGSVAGNVVGLDRIAVIAALNMANELIRFRNRDSNLESDVGGRLRILRERVESALEKGQQLEL